jgi:beta-lactam-binding protein with PASTA domain
LNESLGSTVRAAIVMAVSAVALLAAGCGNEDLVVPKVTGENSDVFEVYERLSDAGFTVEVTDGFRTGPSCQCRNPIVEQWPPAGTRAKRGSAVEIRVGGPGPTPSGGQIPAPDDRNLRLPKLVRLRLDLADRWLAGHNLGWSSDLAPLPATKGDDLLGSYVVTAQDPGVGDRIGARASVGLEAGPSEDVLAKWREPTAVVPQVSGDRDVLSAYDRLHARGLRVTTSQRLAHGPFIPVLGQEPQPGTRVPRGTTVRLILDSGPDRRTVCCDERELTMPDFVGRNLGEVGEWLNRRYLYWKLVDAPPLPPTNTPRMLDPYVVTSQKPAPGTTIPESIPPGSGDELEPIVLRAKLEAR